MKRGVIDDKSRRKAAVRERLEMKKVIAVSVACAVALMGCATSPKELSTTYVSPMQYQAYDCDQLAGEVQRVQVRVNQLGGRLDEAASNDKAIMGVGLVLFWPALFALGGTKQQEAEYSRLKGEYEAIQQASIGKKCPGVIASPQPVPTTNPTTNDAASAQAASSN